MANAINRKTLTDTTQKQYNKNRINYEIGEFALFLFAQPPPSFACTKCVLVVSLHFTPSPSVSLVSARLGLLSNERVCEMSLFDFDFDWFQHTEHIIESKIWFAKMQKKRNERKQKWKKNFQACPNGNICNWRRITRRVTVAAAATGEERRTTLCHLSLSLTHAQHMQYTSNRPVFMRRTPSTEGNKSLCKPIQTSYNLNISRCESMWINRSLHTVAQDRVYAIFRGFLRRVRRTKYESLSVSPLHSHRPTD